jgi:ornithine carbamoyltransferase
LNLLSSLDLSQKEIATLLDLSSRLKRSAASPLSKSSPLLALLFEKTSTRTRVSLEAAMHELGGSCVYIDSHTSQISRGETIHDTARVLGSYVDIIAARVYKHSDIEDLAAAAGVPVINALSDAEHPTQALADVYTIKQVFGKLKGLRIAFVGDIATNTANSLMVTAAKTGMQVSLVGPDACVPSRKYVDAASKYSTVEVSDDMEDGLEGCDVVYTDTFVSMGEEAQASKRRKLFAPYQLNSKTLRFASDGARVMHCLPAHRGEEITSEVLDGKSSIAWVQAENKLHVGKAILLYLLNKVS